MLDDLQRQHMTKY